MKHTFFAFMATFFLTNTAYSADSTAITPSSALKPVTYASPIKYVGSMKTVASAGWNWQNCRDVALSTPCPTNSSLAVMVSVISLDKGGCSITGFNAGGRIQYTYVDASGRTNVHLCFYGKTRNDVGGCDQEDALLEYVLFCSDTGSNIPYDPPF